MSHEAGVKRPLIERDKAADYLTSIGCRISKTTLDSLATRGGGPAFMRSGRRPVYDPDDLDAWARSRLSPKVTSTAELPKKAGAAAPKEAA